MTFCVLERGIIAAVTAKGNTIVLMFGEDVLTLVLEKKN